MSLNARDDGVTNSCSRDAQTKSRPLRQSVHRLAHDLPGILTSIVANVATLVARTSGQQHLVDSLMIVSRIHHVRFASSRDSGRIGFLDMELSQSSRTTNFNH